MQAGAEISAEKLIGFLRNRNLGVIPMEPSLIAIEASIRAIDGYGRLTKQRKHQLRLRAAIKTAVENVLNSKAA